MFRVEESYVVPTVTAFSTSDLKTKSLRTLYDESCLRYHVKKTNPVLRAILPDVPAAHHYVLEIDLSGTYVGRSGLIALLPVLQSCTRIQCLNLSGTGMNTSVGEALLMVLTDKTRLRELNISRNDLGTPVAEALLRFLKSNRNLKKVCVDECMFIAPLKRRIESEAARNALLTDIAPLVEEPITAATTTVTVTVVAAPPPVSPPREPFWMPVVDSDVHDAFYRHRHHIRDMISLFVEGAGGPGIVTEMEFERVMKVCNVASLAGQAPREQQRVPLYCTKLGVYNSVKREVLYLDFLDAVRTHATPGPHRVIDAMYDMKPMLLDAFQMLDVDAVGTVTVEEAVAGVASLRQLSCGNASHGDIGEALALLGVEEGTQIFRYREVLDKIQMVE